jgi:MSHA biogenesis protein MshG
MDEVLKKITAYLEKENQLRQKLQGALRYPIIVFSALAIAFVFAIVVIIPRFSSIFAAFKTELPLPTRILQGINYIIVNFWWMILMAAALGYALFKLYTGTVRGRRQWDGVLLKLPVFGMLLTKISLARFFTMFSSMISSGIPIVNGLETTASTADNTVISDAILKIREKVVSGVSLSESMREFYFFPPTAIHMVAVGEKSGNLENMLVKSAEYFDEETDYIISNLMSLLEPLIIFVLGLFVLLLALGIFLPMWSMTQLYSR